MFGIASAERLPRACDRSQPSMEPPSTSRSEIHRTALSRRLRQRGWDPPAGGDFQFPRLFWVRLHVNLETALLVRTGNATHRPSYENCPFGSSYGVRISGRGLRSPSSGNTQRSNLGFRIRLLDITVCGHRRPSPPGSFESGDVSHSHSLRTLRRLSAFRRDRTTPRGA